MRRGKKAFFMTAAWVFLGVFMGRKGWDGRTIAAVVLSGWK
jgi:hypothetical protein